MTLHVMVPGLTAPVLGWDRILGRMDSATRHQLRELGEHMAGLVDLAREATAHVEAVDAAARGAAEHLAAAAVVVPLGEIPAWRVLALGDEHERPLGALARARALSRPGDRDLLERLLADTPAHLRELRTVTGLRRFFSGPATRRRGRDAADALRRLHDDLHRGDLLTHLLDIRADADDEPAAVPVTEAPSSRVGLGRVLASGGGPLGLLPVGDLRGVGNAVATLLIALHTELEFRDAAQRAAEEMRLAEARAVLAGMPVEGLRDASAERINVGALRQAGVATVLDVFERLGHLEDIPLVGAVTATRVAAAAQTLWRTTYDSTPVHIDITRRTEAATQLLLRLILWGQVRTTTRPAAELARARAVHALLESVTATTTHLAVAPLGDEHTVADFHDELADVLRQAERMRVPPVPEVPADPWDDFRERPAHYYALLSELGFLGEHGGKIQGDVPSDVVDAIRVFNLNTEYLEASLRGYQDFAARFALVQGRVVIGDEMGLGKTIEALAVLAHLRAQGHTRFLVVCPAAVVVNWVREVESKTGLAARRLHGSGRGTALDEWLASGGVGVTSFGTLPWLLRHDVPPGGLGAVVVDEAHYIKNPDAKRSRRVARLLDGVDHVVLMTGTPLLNRLDEFRALVDQVRPDLLAETGDHLSAHDFRRLVAPVYLRRNQEDVLTELPDLVEVDEWVPMSAADENLYRDAVDDGNFMAMRQAACLAGPASAKMRRLVEIVEEAEDNGRRVIVYSHFRAVLEQAAAMLPGPVFGPLTGSVPPPERQEVVDAFTSAPGGAALVAQIVAAGVGLNIQAASVVVICEPQLTPTTEWQAIARAHRMGQLETVQVHRLLSEDGVDERITQVLAGKRALFDDFARESDLAHSAPEAFDITEADLARQVVAAERERLLGA